MASSHLLTGSALATSQWVGISPSQMCLPFICLAFLSLGQALSCAEDSFPTGHSTLLLLYSTEGEAWKCDGGVGKQKNMLRFFLVQFYLGICPKSSLSVSRKICVWTAHHLSCPYLLTTFVHLSVGVTEASNVDGVAHRVKQVCASSPGSLCGVALEMCLQTPSQELPGKRRSCFHSASHLLLALLSGISLAQRRMGIWQGESISLCLHTPPPYLLPKTFCTVQVIYHSELAISFLSADVEEAGKCVPSQEMSDAQEGRVQ